MTSRQLGIFFQIFVVFSEYLNFTGLLQSFQTSKLCHLWLISLREKNCIKYQILIGIIPTFSENFIQINQVWPQLQPQRWSQAILKIYTSLDHFRQPPKMDFGGCHDRLEIQSWLKGEIVPNWISRLSQWQPPKYVLEAVNDKMVQTHVNSENCLGSCLKS